GPIMGHGPGIGPLRPGDVAEPTVANHGEGCVRGDHGVVQEIVVEPADVADLLFVDSLEGSPSRVAHPLTFERTRRQDGERGREEKTRTWALHRAPSHSTRSGAYEPSEYAS